jgi:hypothetical protein
MRRNEEYKRAAVRLAGAVLGLIFSNGLALGDVLYDVTFSTPPHTVGEAPIVGAGSTPRATVSSNSGSPEVVAQSGLLDEQPVEFDLGFEQVRFDLDDLPLSTSYRVECDLLLNGISDVLSYLRVSFNTPTVRNINFNGSGAVEYFVPPDPPVTFANFELDAIVHLRVDIDLSGDTWTISLDGESLHTGSFGGATAIEQVVILSTGTLAFVVQGAADNVLIESDPTVPVKDTSWGSIKGMCDPAP